MLRQVFGWSAGATSIVVCCNFLPHDVSVLDAHRRTSVVGEFFGGELGEANIYRLVTHGVQCRLNIVFRNTCRTLLEQHYQWQLLANILEYLMTIFSRRSFVRYLTKILHYQ